MKRRIQPGTLNKEITTLKAFFNFLVYQRLLAHNPAERLRKVKTDRKEIDILSKNQIQSLLRASEPEYRAIWLGYLLTGLRRSELTALHVSDVNWQTNQLEIVGKGRKRRRIPIAPALAPILKDLCKGKRKADPVFPHHPNLLRCLKQRLRRAGLPDRFNLHSLRHTFASHLIMAGANIVSISRILGHSSIQVTVDTYGHLSPEFNAQQLEHLSGLVDLQQDNNRTKPRRNTGT